MATRKSEDVAKEKLIDSVKTSLNDAESLLREAASSTGDKATELRERAMTSLKRTREALYEAQDAVFERGRKAARATDDYVHDNPWQAIGIAGVTGAGAAPPRAHWVCGDPRRCARPGREPRPMMAGAFRDPTWCVNECGGAPSMCGRPPRLRIRRPARTATLPPGVLALAGAARCASLQGWPAPLCGHGTCMS